MTHSTELFTAHLTATLTRIHFTDLLAPILGNGQFRHPQEVKSIHRFCGRPGKITGVGFAYGGPGSACHAVAIPQPRERRRVRAADDRANGAASTELAPPQAGVVPPVKKSPRGMEKRHERE